MAKLFWQSLLAVPAALGAAVAVSGSAIAAESAVTTQVSNFDQEPIQLAQITSVSELTDVLPSDWAFQALQSLVENYGCIQGYPDRTFRGQRSLTRFEFAAGLNACLDVIATLIAQSGINPDDLATIRRLQEEFQAELATLRGRVDALEAETATLRAQQFSTTTKLRGQADFHLVTPFDTLPTDTSTSVAARARLNFDSSFTGNDRLRIRLQSGQGDAATGFGLANAGGADYNVTVDDFYYSFPLGNRVTVTAAARGLAADDWVTSTILPYDGPGVFDPSGPLFYDFGGSSSNGAGLGVSIAFTDSLILDAGYTAGNAGATSPGVGLFAAANQSYIAQLNLLTDGFFNAAATYLHSDGVAIGVPGSTDTFAGLVNLDFGGFFLAGHGAFTSFEGGDTFSWSAGAGFNNFLAEGTQLGVYVGEAPSVGNKPFFVEGYYEIPFNQFLTVTPSLFYGDTRDAAGGDTTGFWGALRATFRF
ncbi:iron uptake porin [Leptolyngbya sp. KIOST-1]|uniref:iron uptake porin n=1 Tax=Leptolyngbya sp. KIOST-1 TaxID=1229172 RepID=UPI00055A9C54|nr:iron uptake porin [Leptolyngbya sp. KIOST-1]